MKEGQVQGHHAAWRAGDRWLGCSHFPCHYCHTQSLVYAIYTACTKSSSQIINSNFCPQSDHSRSLCRRHSIPSLLGTLSKYVH